MMIAIFLMGCSDDDRKVNTLKDLTYSSDKEEAEYTIMLKETDEYQPYLVLTDNYNGTGRCLLLRKFLLDDTVPYCQNESYHTYYGESYINEYLNNVFWETLDAGVRDKLLLTDLPVTAKQNYVQNEKLVEMLPVHIFLLSREEVTGRSSSDYLQEGRQLKFFDSDERCIALSEEGIPSSWYLRTGCTSDESVINAISAEGGIGIGGIYGPDGPYQNGVRPAFCMDKALHVQEKNGIFYLFEE